MALDTPPRAGVRPGSLRAIRCESSSGVKSAVSGVSAAESMRQVAARLERHTAALRSAMDRTSRLDHVSAIGASAKGAVAAADAADADLAAHEKRLRSYQTADAYIKKAAAKIAGHKKWYADRAKGEKVSESCAGALEELRLASMVLQRRHDEDAADAPAAAARRSRRDAAAAATTAVSGKGRRDVVDAVAVRSAMDAFVATARRLRADADVVASREATARAEIAAARKRETAPPENVAKREPPAPRAFDSNVKEARRKASDDEPKPKPKPRGSETERAPSPARDPGPRAELERALRAATRERDALDSILEEAHARAERQRRAFEAARRADAARVEASAARTRRALGESVRWKALVAATRDDATRGIGAEEAEALRESLRASRDAHRRELSLLGAEHGNQCASLRRVLADTERELSAMRGASEGARHAAARAEEALVSEREARCEAEVLQRRSDGACRRASERCEALEAEVASLRVRLEETARASSDLREAETAARASDE